MEFKELCQMIIKKIEIEMTNLETVTNAFKESLLENRDKITEENMSELMRIIALEERKSTLSVISRYIREEIIKTNIPPRAAIAKIKLVLSNADKRNCFPGIEDDIFSIIDRDIEHYCKDNMMEINNGK